MVRRPSPIDRFHHKLFAAVYDRSLLYNACWEDPAVDRVALDLKPHDTIAMITSAGCNALDYALCGPKKIWAIDANPKQTALLELKLAGIRTLDFETFFALFGAGSHAHINEVYHHHLRAELTPETQAFWDRHLHWFTPTGWRKSFYFHGLSGLFARLINDYVQRHPRLRGGIAELLHARTLDEQREIYDRRVEPALFTPALNWALRRQVTMNLLGVPYPQRREIEASHEDGIAGFIKESVAYVFRELPLKDNYFWQVYLRGSYTAECCPEYLKPANFAALKGGLAERIVPVTAYLTDFLRRPGEPVSRFVLLDHMDWMSWYYPDALTDEWHAILARSAPGARVLYRSASPTPRYLDHVAINDGRSQIALPELLTFHPELATELTKRDRVHTYASFHIADLEVPAALVGAHDRGLSHANRELAVA